jgi:hypothetical protein
MSAFPTTAGLEPGIPGNAALEFERKRALQETQVRLAGLALRAAPEFDSRIAQGAPRIRQQSKVPNDEGNR